MADSNIETIEEENEGDGDQSTSRQNLEEEVTDENADLIDTDINNSAAITDENSDQTKVDEKAAELEENGEVIDQPVEAQLAEEAAESQRSNDGTAVVDSQSTGDVIPEGDEEEELEPEEPTEAEKQDENAEGHHHADDIAQDLDDRQAGDIPQSEDVDSLYVAEPANDEQETDRLSAYEDSGPNYPAEASNRHSHSEGRQEMAINEEGDLYYEEEQVHGEMLQDQSEEEHEPEEAVVPRLNREQLIERYHHAITDRQQLLEQNYQLQHRLAEYFRQRRSDDVRYDERGSADQEQRYVKYMASLDALHQQEMNSSMAYREQINELMRQCHEKEDEVNDARQQFIDFKKYVATSAVSGRSGKAVQSKDVEQHFVAESRKEAEVVAVRLENIRLKNKLRKREAQIKSKEELADGLHLIDFEQLKIENQTYNEKIEERNEELQKLRRKITNTVQVLTHLKEKLQFITGENQVEKVRLQEIEELVAKKRDALSRTKQVRDSLRIDNQRLHQNAGLLGSATLLRDFEDRHDEVENLDRRLSELKTLHAELTLNLQGVRRKIEAASGIVM